jgi:hypothetical protein|tara:strand:+ start:396 stop:644 length:249 start_codon:yes stop_codon:yes gene_type:complete
MKQINLKLPSNLFNVAKRYVENFGYRNIQDLATESMREKIFERNEYDETFSEEEIKIVDQLIKTSLEKKKIASEAELMKALE